MSPDVSSLPILPGSEGLGPTLQLRRNRPRFMRMLSGGGDMFRLQLLDKKVVVVTGPAQVNQLLVEGAASLEKAAMLRHGLYPLAGEGLFTSNGALWKRQRRLMAPIFTPAQIAAFAGGMVECAQRDVDTWRDGEIVDISRETTRIAMSIAGRTLFGAETFSESDEIGAALTEALGWASRQATSPFPLVQITLRRSIEGLAERLAGRPAAWSRRLADGLHRPLLLPVGEDQRVRQAVAMLDRRVQRMIDERRAGGLASSPDLLSRLLSAQDEDDRGVMSDRQVRDEVLTLFVAGHETTASALAWALYLLARHPETLGRAQAEADAIGRPPRYEDLPRLALCLRVFKESMRLYPPVPIFARDVISDIEVGGYRLTPGTVVLVSPYATHHRPDLWPDPEHFDPERFTPEAEATRHRQAFLPFSAGPRVCIGNHFALMEGPLVLATLLQRATFALTSTDEIEADIQATLRPRGGVPMRVRLRPS
jgi:cytochrome P450